jgi:hypothetical protein
VASIFRFRRNRQRRIDLNWRYAEPVFFLASGIVFTVVSLRAGKVGRFFKKTQPFNQEDIIVQFKNSSDFVAE